MRWEERPFCERRQRGASQFPKVEILPELLDYALGDDFPADSLVSIPNSGGPVYNNRADGYGGGRCSFKPLFLVIIVEAAAIKKQKNLCR